MSQHDVETVRAGYEDFARGDIPGVLARFDPSMSWEVPATLPWGGEYHGPEAIGAFFASLGDYLDELSVQPESFHDAGDHVVAVGRHVGKAKGGDAFETSWAMVWQMRDGKPVSLTEYVDTHPMVQALEAAGVA